MVRRASAKPQYVTVVADNPQTIEVLSSYFKRVGSRLQTAHASSIQS